MGCCVSSNRASSTDSFSQKNQNSSFENRAPPPVEEETVKEVLSETPKWKPAIARLETPEKPLGPLEKPGFEESKEETKIEKPLPVEKVEEISEISEVCSWSESMSTTTITDNREETEEIRKRVNGSPAKMRKNRSFSDDFAGRRDRTMGMSPTRRGSEQSPGRKNVGSMRRVLSRDQPGHAISNKGTRNEPHRRDPGDNSGRRSRSPATRTDNGITKSIVGRSPSARRTNRSPARVRSHPPESGHRKAESSSMEEKWSSANESLENPLVSLECFIFL